MQGSPGHHRAAETDGFEYGHRRDPSRSTRVDFHREELCLLLFRRILICDRPVRELDRRAELLTLCEVVQLDYRAVYVVGEFSPRLSDLLYRVPDLVRGPAEVILLDDLDAVLLKVFVAFEVRLECDALRLLHVEDEQGQASVSRDPRIRLAERARSAVTRVGKCLLAVLFRFLVDLRESLARHVHFASYLDVRHGIGHTPHDIIYHARIHRDVFAFGYAVASGHCELEFAFFVS